MRLPYHIALIAHLLLLLSPLAIGRAEQLSFQRSEAGDVTHYAYTFKERNREHQLHFFLPRVSVQAAYSSSPSLRGTQALTAAQSEELWKKANQDLDARVSQREIHFEKEVNAMAEQLSEALGKDGDLKVVWRDEEFTIRTVPPTGNFSKTEAKRVEATLKRAMGQLSLYADSLLAQQESQMRSDVSETEQVLQSETDAIASRALIAGLLRKVPGSDVVTVDYKAATQLSIPSMKPLADALVAGAPQHTRGRLALALSFFQAIPYDSFSGRKVGPDMGFLLPAAALNENRGDCDTKSVALSAVLANLLPEHKVVMVILPGHAILGIDLPVHSDDAAINHAGKRYVLLEPAGPGQYPAGQLCEESLRALEAGKVEQILPLGG